MWRGNHLEVKTVESTGGQGGKALQVYVPSLPPTLRAAWMNRNSGALTAQIVPALALPAPAIIDQNIASRVAEREWKLAIIAPALVFKKGTKGRAETLRDIADRKHRDIHGKTVTYSIDTLRDWCALVEANDHGNLARPRRRDAGKRRNFVNRIWDKACPLPDTEKLRLADEIRAYLKGLWKECGKGEKKITSLGTTKLLELSLAAGWQGTSHSNDRGTIGADIFTAGRGIGNQVITQIALCYLFEDQIVEGISKALDSLSWPDERESIPLSTIQDRVSQLEDETRAALKEREELVGLLTAYKIAT
jgi:hypothetical protein